MANTTPADERVTLVHRRTLPTKAFTLKVSQCRWIESEAVKRDISQSEVVRLVIDAAMVSDDTEAEAA